MLSDVHLAANLRAAGRVLGTAPVLSRPDPDRVRLTRDGDRLLVDVRAPDGPWEALTPAAPAAVARAASAIRDAAGRRVLLVGAGLGEVLEAAEAGGTPGPVIAIEPDPAIALVMLARRDWRAWFEAGLVLLVGPAFAGASACTRGLDVSRDPLLVELPSPAARTAAMTGARALARRLVAEAHANLEARRRFAGRYLLQTLTNLDVVAAEGDAADLAGLFPNTPAVIVGAGPSLDASLPAIARVADRALVIASDTTLRPLAGAGVAPHLTVAVDPGDANARHLTGLPALSRTFLVGEASLHPACFEGFRGRTFTFQVSQHEPWPWLAEQRLTRGRLRAWGSVVTSAMDLALVMGCDPVIFVGTDLAFTGGRTYCRHTAHEEVWGKWIAAGHTWDEVWAALVSQWPDTRAVDLHGADTRTAPHLVAFRNWIVEQAAAAPARVINATTDGILHGAGIELQGLEDALAGARPIDAGAVSAALVRAHGRRRSVPLTQAVEAVRNDAAAGRDTALLTRWITFAGGALDRTQVVTALETAARRLVPGARGAQ